jgi:hypothetical protein
MSFASSTTTLAGQDLHELHNHQESPFRLNNGVCACVCVCVCVRVYDNTFQVRG